MLSTRAYQVWAVPRALLVKVVPLVDQVDPSGLTFKVPVPPPDAVTVTLVEAEAVVAVEKVRFVGAAGATGADDRVTVKVMPVELKVDPSPPVLVGLLTKNLYVSELPAEGRELEKEMFCEEELLATTAVTKLVD